MNSNVAPPRALSDHSHPVQGSSFTGHQVANVLKLLMLGLICSLARELRARLRRHADGAGIARPSLSTAKRRWISCVSFSLSRSLQRASANCCSAHSTSSCTSQHRSAV